MSDLAGWIQIVLKMKSDLNWAVTHQTCYLYVNIFTNHDLKSASLLPRFINIPVKITLFVPEPMEALL